MRRYEIGLLLIFVGTLEALGTLAPGCLVAGILIILLSEA